MNSRECISAAIEHREPDRVPNDFGGSMVTSIHQDAFPKLKEYADINTEYEIQIARSRSLVAAIDPEVHDFFSTDTHMLQRQS